jgi:Zn-dependent metalloprotease
MTPPCRCCFIVPPHLLRSLAAGGTVRPRAPEMFADTLAQTDALAAARPNSGIAGGLGDGGLGDGQAPNDAPVDPALLAASPTHLFDCARQTALPGAAIADLALGGAAASAIAASTAEVLTFYRKVLNRDAIDGAGGPVYSSLNYGQNFVNAYWSGQIMVYGNGDQQVLGDFWQAPDVICHEITHGVTQHESGLVYTGESGAVNESISDCVAAAYNQWRQRKAANDPAGWLLGAGMLGPAARAEGYNCLRNMLHPTATQNLSQQPSIYPNRDQSGDVHRNSGIPNRAFAVFAQAIGGNAFEAPIRLWHAAATQQALTATAAIADWAAATLRAADAWPGTDRTALITALRAAWTTVQVTPAA